MSTEVNATTLALEAAYSWVSAVCDWDECDTVERAVAYLTQERDSLGWREFEENCRYSLALIELGQTCDNVVINEVFNLYKSGELSRNELITLINTNDETVEKVLAYDDMPRLLTLSPEFLIEFFELDDEEQDIALTWLNYHDFKTFGNDPSDITNKYQGTYSAVEYVQKFLEESEIELPEVIHLDYERSFEDLSSDYTCIDLGNGSYMIFNY